MVSLCYIWLDKVRSHLVRFGSIFASTAFDDLTVNDCGNYNGKHFLHDYIY